jgi:hypothetical protein
MFHHGKSQYIKRGNELLDGIKERFGENSAMHEMAKQKFLPYPEIWNRCYKAVSTSEQSRIAEIYDVETHSQRIAVEPSRNTEYTERASNEPTTTQEAQMGNITDVAPVDHAKLLGPYQPPHKDTNMEEFDMDKSLSRLYYLGTINWTGTSTTNTMLGYYYFPDVLFAQSYIADKIRNFARFKAGMRFTIRVVSNKFAYGKLLIFFFPNGSYGTPTTTYANAVLASGLPHVIVSASEGSVTVFDAPFMSASRCIDPTSYTPAEMGLFGVIVLNPLTDTNGTTPQAQIQVSAQFLEPKLFFPYTPTSAICSEDDCISDVETHSSNGQHLAEAEAKAREQSISNALTTFSDVAGSLSSIPVYGRLAKATSMVASNSARIAAKMGLDKPNTLNMTNINKVNAYSDWNNSKGVNAFPKFSMDPENSVTTQNILGGSNQDDMNFVNFVKKPMLCNIVTITSSTVTVALCPINFFGNTYVDNVSSLFKYASGSFKFKIYTTASLFHSVRAVFWINNTSSIKTDWQECNYRIVDIQGDTETEIMTPYYSKKIVHATTNTTGACLMVTILNWTQPDMSLTCPIFMNVYKAGCDDFQVGAPRNVWLQMTNSIIEDDIKDYIDVSDDIIDVEVHVNPRGDFEHDFEPIHPDCKYYVHENIVFGEKIQTFADLFKRFHPYKAMNTDEVFLMDSNLLTIAGHTGLIGIEALQANFLLFRGSIGSRVAVSYAETNVAMILKYSSTEIAPGIASSTDVNPVLEAMMPFYSQEMYYAYVPNAYCNDDNRFFVTAGSTRANYYGKMAGDDWTSMFQVPLPNGSAYVDQNSNTAGWFGLCNFLNS